MGVLTWRELRELLIKEFSVMTEIVPLNLGGQTQEFTALTRNVDGDTIVFSSDVLIEDDEFVQWAVVRNICDTLRIEKSERHKLGLALG